jgi:hypothetical protein
VPGRVFKGNVALVLDVIAAGQFKATGTLQDCRGNRGPDDISAYQIPLGAAAQVAILTEHWHHAPLLRRILLRMRSGQN